MLDLGFGRKKTNYFFEFLPQKMTLVIANPKFYFFIYSPLPNLTPSFEVEKNCTTLGTLWKKMPANDNIFRFWNTRNHRGGCKVCH